MSVSNVHRKGQWVGSLPVEEVCQVTYSTSWWTEKEGKKTETGCCSAANVHKFKLEEPKKVFPPWPFVLRLNPESNEAESNSLKLTITVTIYYHYLVDLPKLTRN